jgi:hypothetical protein
MAVSAERDAAQRELRDTKLQLASEQRRVSSLEQELQTAYGRVDSLESALQKAEAERESAPTGRVLSPTAGASPPQSQLHVSHLGELDSDVRRAFEAEYEHRLAVCLCFVMFFGVCCFCFVSSD